MSNRSYPAAFSRPLREVPVATDEDVQRMLERLRRRCKIGKVSVNDSSVAQFRGIPEASAPAGVVEQPRQGMVVGSNPSVAVANIDAASSAGPTLPAGSSVVSGTAAITATAGGGSNGVEHTAGFPFQPTRSAPLEWERIGPYAMRTLCGTWTCCKVTIGGVASYELWRRISGLERPVRVLTPCKSFQDAKAAAQAEMDACD